MQLKLEHWDPNQNVTVIVYARTPGLPRATVISVTVEDHEWGDGCSMPLTREQAISLRDFITQALRPTPSLT